MSAKIFRRQKVTRFSPGDENFYRRKIFADEIFADKVFTDKVFSCWLSSSADCSIYKTKAIVKWRPLSDECSQHIVGTCLDVALIGPIFATFGCRL